MFFRPKYYRNYEKIILEMNGGNFLSFRELSNQATNLFKHLSVGMKRFSIFLTVRYGFIVIFLKITVKPYRTVP